MQTFPIVRWVAVVWLAVWAPTYWIFWGPQNFLQLCDVALILTCVALWMANPVLLSSQAVGAIAINAVWTLNVVWRLVLGRFLLPGTEYFFDPQYPLWVRLLSLYHVALPVLLIWAARRVGYDRRGWLVQSGIAAVMFAVSRAIQPAVNLNNVYSDPFVGRTWGPAPVHLALTWAVLVAVVYWPTHWVLSKTLPRTRLL